MAGPSEVLARGRGHWEIENRVHYVRDFSYDEDRDRIRKGRLSRNLACLTNAAISSASRAGSPPATGEPALCRRAGRGFARGPRATRLTSPNLSGTMLDRPVDARVCPTFVSNLHCARKRRF